MRCTDIVGRLRPSSKRLMQFRYKLAFDADFSCESPSAIRLARGITNVPCVGLIRKSLACSRSFYNKNGTQALDS
jgi:hypothetical protein